MTKETAEKILAGMREGYRKAAAETATSRERLYGEELKRFVDYVREGESVLDVGCGDGRALEAFDGKRVSYAGVDLSEDVIARAKERWKERAVFQAGDILELPVPDGRYDAVLALGVLHHVPSKALRAQAVRELARAARKGGYVMIATWNLWQPRYWGVLSHQMFGHRNGWDFGDLKITWKKPQFPRYYHAFTMKEMRELCEDAGMDVVELYYVRNGEISDWRGGQNLVVIARKR